jgi:hypothetical protein
MMNLPKSKFGEADVFALQATYPDPLDALCFAPEPLDEAVTRAIVVLDASVLLVPYETGPSSLAAIEHQYGQLATANRLVVPGQAVREFLGRRAGKLAELYQRLEKVELPPRPDTKYPVLETIPEYQEMRALEEVAWQQLREYHKARRAVLDRIRGLHWDDPVSALYRTVLTPAVVADASAAATAEEQVAVVTERDRRKVNSLPPGYKDYPGIGDLLIWRTILATGQTRQLPVIFVTGEEKADWRYLYSGTFVWPLAGSRCRLKGSAAGGQDARAPRAGRMGGGVHGLTGAVPRHAAPLYTSEVGAALRRRTPWGHRAEERRALGRRGGRR